jgi:creatinine amidohydrolase/Fe(II)-dependent formamide hydrolase-like protein
VIVGTAGTEQRGRMVDGEHKFVMHMRPTKLRAVGKTLVAPVIAYVLEGSWDTVGGHMGKPGTITLPEDRFVELLVTTGRSLKPGETTVLFLENRAATAPACAAATAQRVVEGHGHGTDRRLHEVSRRSAHHITEHLKIPADQIGNHANIQDTSEMLFVNPAHVRRAKMAPGGGYANSGVTGDPTKATAALGKLFVQIKIDNAVAQIKGLMAGTLKPAEPPAARAGGAGARGGGAGRGGRAGDATTAPAGLRRTPPTRSSSTN